jgi:hypothetical protein
MMVGWETGHKEAHSASTAEKEILIFSQTVFSTRLSPEIVITRLIFLNRICRASSHSGHPEDRDFVVYQDKSY